MHPSTLPIANSSFPAHAKHYDMHLCFLKVDSICVRLRDCETNLLIKKNSNCALKIATCRKQNVRFDAHAAIAGLYQGYVLD
jgi:hypothetical protein